MRWWLMSTTFLRTLIIAIFVCVIGTGMQTFTLGQSEGAIAASQSQAIAAQISETSPPEVIQALRWDLAPYHPQVEIVSPAPQQVIQDDTISVKFRVKDLPIFKDEDLGLGPHLLVLLDNQSYQAVYDLNQPLTLKDLTPGTHTIRAFAAFPWHESFKNDGAYSQVTFHSFVKTQEHTPDPSLPLLTYSQPQGEIGAEPVMLDFYLTNVGETSPVQSKSSNWTVCVTVNGSSFTVNKWQPLYLSGFKSGKNWVRLELLDQQGNPISNIFNDTVKLLTLSFDSQDPLAQLVRGELSIADAKGIVDPSYIPKPVIQPETTSVEAGSPGAIAPEQ